MIDATLINRLEALAGKEKKINAYKRRLRLKGRVVAKGATKKGNLTLSIEKEGEKYSFTVLKSHKERYALAALLEIGKSVSIEGIPRFRMVICTRLKVLGRGVSEGRQAKLKSFAV